MSLSKNLSFYSDIHAVFEAVLKNEGGSVTLPTKGKAVHWRMRANYYRTLLHKQQRLSSVMEMPMTETPYDNLAIQQDKDDPCTMNIVIGGVATGEFTAPNGATTAIREMRKTVVQSVEADDTDNLADLAKEFAAGLEGKGNE